MNVSNYKIDIDRLFSIILSKGEDDNKTVNSSVTETYGDNIEDTSYGSLRLLSKEVNQSTYYGNDTATDVKSKIISTLIDVLFSIETESVTPGEMVAINTLLSYGIISKIKNKK